MSATQACRPCTAVTRFRVTFSCRSFIMKLSRKAGTVVHGRHGYTSCATLRRRVWRFLLYLLPGLFGARGARVEPVADVAAQAEVGRHARNVATWARRVRQVFRDLVVGRRPGG